MEKNPQQRFASAGDIAFQLGEMSGLRSSTTLAAVAAPAPRASRRWIFAAAGTAGLILVAAATWVLARATARSEPPNFLQVSFQQGSVDSARFLPDGQSFISASRWGTDIDMSLYTGRLDSQGLRPLGVKADAIASVSESGELLIRQNEHRIGPGYAVVGTLARAPLGGGAPRAVLDNVQYADWAPGGKDFLIVRFIPETHSYRLEYPVGRVLVETTGWFSDPRFSRDGKTIAFLDHPIFGDDQGSAAVVDLEGHKKILSPSYGSAQGVAWSPKGDEIWFAAASNGVARSLYATTLRGRVRTLLTGPGDLTIQDVLPNGRALVRGMNERIIVMVTTPEFPQPRDFTAMDWAYGARFSSDSKQILIGDQHSGPMYGTFLRNLDGSPAVRLGDGDPLDLSADGKWAITRLPVSPDQILLLPTGAGEPRQLTHTNVTHLDARWLPDGRIVAVGNEPGHRERTFLVDLKGNESPLTPEGMRTIAVSPDGKRLLVFNADASEFQFFSMDGGAVQKVTQVQNGEGPIDFTADGAGLFVRHRGPNREVEIWRVELANDKRTLLRTITPGEVPAITVSLSALVAPDGKSFAMTYARELSTEFVVDGLK